MKMLASHLGLAKILKNFNKFLKFQEQMTGMNMIRRLFMNVFDWFRCDKFSSRRKCATMNLNDEQNIR